ncbi:LacI family DNA-binding transcriptional regulator [Microlunatus soli]|uniref:DNA-binding transcriptional regulator, LacI/PurR family n=1 Tax=Microlunatus soli TaxID=630515 RepID=A0A1H1Z9E7_9ACTN|nr:LacI family DNA-binding transcriptional regulator [Microlunatus soli]SDT30187.1 DNA-binding transcriptional regulator, LacI/PurR family [Microlunatus soli]
MARVTIDDLAARLGLSRASVSYALNGRPGVGDETRMRVTALAAELGWQPSVSARSLSRRRADAYGIVLNRQPEDLGSEPYYMGLLSGIESALSETGVSLMIRFVADQDSEAAVYRTWNAEGRVDGVLLTDLRTDDPRPALLDELTLTYLVHGGRRAADGWNFDQATDAATLVDHLAELGHRRIVHISGPPDLLHETERRRAVREIGGRRGMEVITVQGDYTFDGSRELTGSLLEDRRRPTAIIYSNDLMAVGGSIALRSATEPIAVLSWDDSLLCRTASPSITALQRDPYGAGRFSAERLIKLVEEDDHSELLPRSRSALIIRESSLRQTP